MTIALPRGDRAWSPRAPQPRPRRRLTLKRVLIGTGSALVALILLAGSWIGLSLYRIDHAVHHVGIPAWLLARGKNDLLAIVKGPDHSEQVFVFHDTGGHTNVLQIPNSAGAAPRRRRHRPARHAQPPRAHRHHRRARPVWASRSATTSASTCTW